VEPGRRRRTHRSRIRAFTKPAPSGLSHDGVAHEHLVDDVLVGLEDRDLDDLPVRDAAMWTRRSSAR
jgi:hypothetical protein